MTSRTVFVSGGSGGLGTAVTGAFTAAGWRVAAPGRADADLLDPASAAAAVAAAAADPAAPLRAVVNLVGGYASGGRVHETPLDDFEAMLRLNLHPTFNVTAAALSHLVSAGGGAVICVSSRAALAPFPGAAGYIAAKAAVLAFAEAVAVEYRASGVRCNTVIPGTIDTPRNRAAQPDADTSRWTGPAAIASVITFLAGDDAAAITGARVPV